MTDKVKMNNIRNKNKMKKMKPTTYNDFITNCDIMLTPRGKMFIIRDGKKMRLNAVIIKDNKKREVN